MAETSASTNPPPGVDKLLAMGAYGESVAAYRYLVLAEKAENEEQRRTFADMADEEQEHKQRLQKILTERFPDADFVLSAEDKERVITGPRLLDAHTDLSFAEVMAMMVHTERKVAAFYARYGKQINDPQIRSLFHELAEEGAGHSKRLEALARAAGVEGF